MNHHVNIISITQTTNRTRNSTNIITLAQFSCYYPETSADRETETHNIMLTSYYLLIHTQNQKHLTLQSHCAHASTKKYTHILLQLYSAIPISSCYYVETEADTHSDVSILLSINIC